MIGVVLMVAIAVIMAAAVGTFVLGATDSMKDPSPSAEFDFAKETNGDITIRHIGGDPIDADRLTVMAGGSQAGTQFSGTVTAGTSITVSASTGDRIEIVWTGPDGETRILSQWEVP